MKHSTYSMVALSLIFFLACAQVLLYVYPNALFLATYPKDWVTYYFIGTGFVELTITFALAPLTKHSDRSSGILILALAAVAALFIPLLNSNYYIIFIFALFLDGLNLILAIVVWNAYRNAFDLLEYKKMSQRASAMSSFGTILISGAISILLTSISLHVLAHLIIFTTAICGMMLLYLKPIVTESSAPAAQTVNPFKYPLYVRIFTLAFIISVTATFTDYLLKYELTAYSMQDIASFIAQFNFWCGLISLILSLFAIQLILKRFNVVGLYVTLPLYWIITSALVAFYPSFYNIILLAAGKLIIYYSLVSTARELSINVLSVEVKNRAQIYLKAIASPLAGLAAAFLLYMLFKLLNQRGLAVVIFILATLLLGLLFKLKQLYFDTLKESLYFGHFSDSNLTPLEKKYLQKSILSRLKNPKCDDDSVYLFLSLLLQLGQVTIPPSLFFLLHHHNVNIRLLMLRLIQINHTKAAVIDILKQIDMETDREVMWHLVDTGLTFDKNQIMKKYPAIISNPNPEIHFIALRIMFSDTETVERAINQFDRLVTSTKTEGRIQAARLLPYYPTQKNALYQQMISDPDHLVASAGIESALQRHNEELLSAIIDRIIKGGISTRVVRKLTLFNDAIVPYFIKNLPRMPYTRFVDVRRAISLFATIPSPKAELALIELVKKIPINFKQYIIERLAWRAERKLSTSSSTQFAIQNIQFELSCIQTLRQQLEKDLSSHVVAEVQSRIFLAKHRLLHSIIVYYKCFDVFSIIPLILTGSQVDRAKAIEYLCLRLPNASNKQAIEATLTNNDSKQLPLPLNKLNDIFIESMLSVETSAKGLYSMDELLKLTILRKVDLFESLSAEALLTISSAFENKHFSDQAIILTQGDYPHGFYIVVKGSVEITKGQHKRIAKQNEVFGAINMLSGRVSTATVKSIGDIELLYIKKEAFDSIAEDLPGVLRAVVSVLASYVHDH